ncbi:MAG: hypothetical protein PHN68_10995 [Prolixibacteraceae bacterium]|nr:hypothetical protein [Prolixibacteraceae bacterium]MDD4756842.1 hypothetical protein [Prolixibacteraceae bacterium]
MSSVYKEQEMPDSYRFTCHVQFSGDFIACITRFLTPSVGGV